MAVRGGLLTRQVRLMFTVITMMRVLYTIVLYCASVRYILPYILMIYNTVYRIYIPCAYMYTILHYTTLYLSYHILYYTTLYTVYYSTHIYYIYRQDDLLRRGACQPGLPQPLPFRVQSDVPCP